MNDERVKQHADGTLWFEPGHGLLATELLGVDDLCGVGFLNSGPYDPFRAAARVHDRMYQNRAWWEDRGWNLRQMNDWFYQDCLLIIDEVMHLPSQTDVKAALKKRYGVDHDYVLENLLRDKAEQYRRWLYQFGAIFYYRHPAGTGATL